MNNIYIKLLQEFETTGLSSKRSISKFMERNFDIPTATTIDEWQKQNENAYEFLENVKSTPHLKFDETQKYHIGYSDQSKTFRWYNLVDIDARLTIEGLEFLERRKTNEKLKRNSINQTRILLLTALIAVCGTCITIYNINSDDLKDKQRLQLQEQSKQIHTLQIELSKSMNQKIPDLKATTGVKKK